MTDRPILFSAPMVRALLDGWKTQTRRVLTAYCDEAPAFVEDGVVTALDENDRPYRWPKKPAVGDRLWVRESFNHAFRLDDDECPEGEEQVFYRADGQPFDRYLCPKTDRWLDGMPWKPSIHMPRLASRLTLIVESVKVERLQDISRGDAMAEGCPFPNIAKGDDPRRWFGDLWNSINGAGSWQANPWVVAIGFRVIRESIDRIIP